MAKKDFSQDSEDVFNSMFSMSTINKVERKNDNEIKPKKSNDIIKKNKKVVKEEPEINVEKPITPENTSNIEKISKPIIDSLNNNKVKKENRFNFYLDTELKEYFNNILWIKRSKNSSSYINNLIKQDLIKTLGLNENSSLNEILVAWEQYKIENNL